MKTHKIPSWETKCASDLVAAIRASPTPKTAPMWRSYRAHSFAVFIGHTDWEHIVVDCSDGTRYSWPIDPTKSPQVSAGTARKAAKFAENLHNKIIADAISWVATYYREKK